MHRSRMQHMLHSEYIYSEYFNCITLITLTYFYFLHAVGQQLTISFSSDRLVVWSLKSCFVCNPKISSCMEETRKYPHFISREFSFQSILRIVGDQCDSWELVAALDAGLLLECSHRSFFYSSAGSKYFFHQWGNEITVTQISTGDKLMANLKTLFSQKGNNSPNIACLGTLHSSPIQLRLQSLHKRIFYREKSIAITLWNMKWKLRQITALIFSLCFLPANFPARKSISKLTQMSRTV